MVSDDLGGSWKVVGRLIDDGNGNRVRPYVKYASNGRSTIHFIFTEGHPRNENNSVYHACYRAGGLYRSDGELIHELTEGPIRSSQATRIFEGDANNVALGQ